MDTTKEIEMSLTNASGKEELKTNVGGHEYSIDFTSDDQSKLRDFFLACLNELKQSQFKFKFVDLNEVTSDVLKIVSQNYINELNKELEKVYEKIKEAQAE